MAGGSGEREGQSEQESKVTLFALGDSMIGLGARQKNKNLHMIPVLSPYEEPILTGVLPQISH